MNEIESMKINFFLAAKKDVVSPRGGKETGNATKTAEPVCDKFAPQTFKPLFCANCFNAKADHQSATSTFFDSFE